MAERCADCRFWLPVAQQKQRGECRARPPVVVEAIVSAWIERVELGERDLDLVAENALGDATHFPRTRRPGVTSSRDRRGSRYAEREHRCENCLWWDRGAPTLATAARDPSQPDDVGACRSAGPELHRQGPLGMATYWPVTRFDCRCPMWQPIGGDDGAREDRPDNVVALERRAA